MPNQSLSGKWECKDCKCKEDCPVVRHIKQGRERVAILWMTTFCGGVNEKVHL